TAACGASVSAAAGDATGIGWATASTTASVCAASARPTRTSRCTAAAAWAARTTTRTTTADRSNVPLHRGGGTERSLIGAPEGTVAAERSVVYRKAGQQRPRQRNAP